MLLVLLWGLADAYTDMILSDPVWEICPICKAGIEISAELHSPARMAAKLPTPASRSFTCTQWSQSLSFLLTFWALERERERGGGAAAEVAAAAEAEAEAERKGLHCNCSERSDLLHSRGRQSWVGRYHPHDDWFLSNTHRHSQDPKSSRALQGQSSGWW